MGPFEMDAVNCRHDVRSGTYCQTASHGTGEPPGQTAPQMPNTSHAEFPFPGLLLGGSLAYYIMFGPHGNSSAAVHQYMEPDSEVGHSFIEGLTEHNSIAMQSLIMVQPARYRSLAVQRQPLSRASLIGHGWILLLCPKISQCAMQCLSTIMTGSKHTAACHGSCGK